MCFEFVLVLLQRNYRFFFMFISTSTTLCIYVFVFSWLNIFQRHMDEKISIWKAISKDVLSDILIVYCFITVWFVGGLTIFHSYLICTNQVIRKIYALFQIFKVFFLSLFCFNGESVLCRLLMRISDTDMIRRRIHTTREFWGIYGKYFCLRFLHQ